MLSVTNDDILAQTKAVERHYKSAASAPLFHDKFMDKVYHNLYKNMEGYPKEIKIPKSIGSLLQGDLEPSKIITLDKPLYYDDKYPMWVGDSTDGVFLRGIGYRNGDSRYPSDISLNDSNIHAILGGMSGQGKSVTLNAIITTVATEYAPWEVKLTLADAKVVEFKKYAKDPLPHIASIAATQDTDYIISVLEDLYDEMLKLNSVFSRYGVSNISSFRKKTGLSVPRNLIIIDEVQTMFVQAGRKASKLLEIFDLFGRLGRSTGYHMILCSQEPGEIPDQTLSNIQVRMALGCLERVSQKILNNGEAKINYNMKGRLIVNTNPANEDKRDNIHFRVPYQPDDMFHSRKKYLREMGERVGFAYNLAFYDEADVMDEKSYAEVISKISTRTDRIYLGEPSFVMRDPEKINLVRMNFLHDDIENVLVYCPTVKSIERYLKMLKINISCMGNRVINKVFTADPALTEKVGFEDLNTTPIEFRNFNNPNFTPHMETVYLRRLLVEVDDISFSTPQLSDETDKFFYSAFEKGSKFDTELNRYRTYSLLYLLSSEFYNRALGLSEIHNSEVLVQKRLHYIKTLINFYASSNCEVERFTFDKLKPIFNWVISIDRVIGLGRDWSSGCEEQFKKVLQDSYAAKVIWICSGSNFESLTGLKSVWRYVISEGMDASKGRRVGADEYPDSLSNVLGLLFDKNSEEQEPLKFKKMAFEGEILTA